MSARLVRSFYKNTRGAVAPTYAIALLGLITIGGVGFDYGRMVSLDSELQNAADQAALAGATQLDKELGACERAASAARLFIQNETRLANDGVANAVTIQNEPGCDAVGKIRFWQDREKSEAADDDLNARFIEVIVDARAAQYALTPVAGAFNSGLMDAAAMAGLGSSICKVPPLMMCQQPDWEVTEGQGLRLVAGQGGSWTPGNFGFLEVNAKGASALERALGADVPVGECTGVDEINTEPGAKVSAVDAINTRFDIYENGLVSYCDEDAGNCSPAMNVRKDAAHVQFKSSSGKGGGPPNNCGFNTGSDPWTIPDTNQYLPDPSTGVQTTTPWVMGHPRDICHAKSFDGTCSDGRLGDGIWDRSKYVSVNYPNASDLALVQTAASELGFSWSSITRYQMYQAELAANDDLSATTKQRLAYSATQGGKTTSYYSFLGPQCATGKPASEDQLDRRLAAIAVVDCNEYNDKEDAIVKGRATGVKVTKWVQVFFVEPSIDRPRTSKGDIYVEIVREVQVGDGNDPTLPVRKDVPYLIQ